jgi:hypothetical protein
MENSVFGYKAVENLKLGNCNVSLRNIESEH